MMFVFSLLVEGSVWYSQDGCTKQATLLSFPGDLRVEDMNGPTDLLSEDGQITVKLCGILRAYSKWVKEECKFV